MLSMNRLSIVVYIIMIWSSVAFCRAGDTVGLYADTQGTDCNIQDVVPGLLTIYLIHKTDEATASCWATPVPSCATAIFLSGHDPWGFCGNTTLGCCLGYGTCLSGSIHVVSVNFFGQGTTPPCCFYPVEPDPRSPSGQIEVVDCDGNLDFGIGEVAVINGDASCPCGFTVPVEETTWGAVKALYND